MSELDADVEGEEGGDEFGARETDLAEDAGEAHSVEEAEAEDDQRPPGVEPVGEDVFDGDVDDGEGDEGLDDGRGSATTP